MTLGIAHRAPATAERAGRLLAAGAGMVEVDVQLRGEQVVVSHYRPLPGGLQRDNWRLRAGPGRDPSLTAVLDRLPAATPVLLDPKHHRGSDALELAAALGELVPGHGGAARFTVSAEPVDALAAYRALGLRTWRSIRDRATLREVLSDGARSGTLPEAGVSVRHTLLDAETVRGLHARTGIIAAWTVNSPRRAHHLVGLGVDAVTTDRLAVLTAVVSPAARHPAGPDRRK